jgi:hypothetical protein
VVASWIVLRLKPRWAPMLGGPKIGRGPRKRESRRKMHNSRKTGRKGISESLYSPQKLRISLHVSSHPLL